MLSILILLTLAYFFYSGARRGLYMQLFNTLGYALSFGVAYLLADGLGKQLTLVVPYPSATEQSTFTFFTNQVGLTLDAAFYRGFAFVFIFGIGWLVTRFVALWFHQLTYAGHNPRLSWILGGLLNLLVGYLIVFMILYLLALIPVAGIQSGLQNSLLARLIVRYSPGLTNLFTQWWIIAA
ncbi:CvpA family protein [Lacticaseibacillus saniviri]|nr:CvpA family protein [Lacticaseibacillus saniviri]MCG4282325.1 CvpA family protein [Lacticaseibacillus saniviri]